MTESLKMAQAREIQSARNLARTASTCLMHSMGKFVRAAEILSGDDVTLYGAAYELMRDTLNTVMIDAQTEASLAAGCGDRAMRLESKQ